MIPPLLHQFLNLQADFDGTSFESGISKAISDCQGHLDDMDRWTEAGLAMLEAGETKGEKTRQKMRRKQQQQQSVFLSGRLKTRIESALARTFKLCILSAYRKGC